MSKAVLSPEPELSPETAQRRAVRVPKATPVPSTAPAEGAQPSVGRGHAWMQARWLPWAIGGGVGALILAATVFHYAYFLPQLDKPTKLFLLDSVFEVTVAVGIALAAATTGVRILRQFPRGDRSRLESGLLAYGLGTGALSLVTAAVGLLHGYYFPILLGVVVAPLVLFRADLRRVVAALTPTRPGFALADLAPRNVCESAICTLTLAMAALIGEHLLVPFWGFDIFMYHFALPERFLALHTLFGSPGQPQANLPYNNEMLNLLALNFRAEIGAGMLQGFFVGATCLAVYALGRRLFTRRTAWLGMALFLAMPLVLYYTSSGLIDQQFAFMGLLVIITLLEYRATPHPAWIVLAGLLIGIGLGVKYQIVYLVGPMMIPLALWSRPADTRALMPWLRLVALNVAILALCAADAFGLWALREWAQVGNPVYPLIWGGAEWTPQRMDFYKSQFDNFGSFHHAILGKLVAVFDWFGHWGRYDYTPLPPLAAVALAALAPAALVLPARTVAARRTRANVLLLCWLALASLLLWGFVNQLVPRYVLPTFGLLALLAAVVLDRAVRWATVRLTPRGRDQALAIVAVLALLPGIMYAVQQRTTSDPSPVYTGQQSYGAYMQATQMWPSYWRTVDFFNQQVPLTTHVLGVNIAAGYFFNDPYLTPDMNRDIIPYLHQIAPTEEAKLAWLRDHGYTYVIYDRTVSQWSQARDPDNLLTPLVPPFEAFLNHRLVLVRSLDGTDVYLVPPPPGGA